MNGRILDLYRRLSGSYKAFFVPHDAEVSLKYLQWVIERARKKNCVIMSEVRTLKDKFGYARNINFIQIFKIELEFSSLTKHETVLIWNTFFSFEDSVLFHLIL